MRRTIFLLPMLLLILCVTSITAFDTGALGQTADVLRTPPKGSAERKAIMDALREDFEKQTNAKVTFVVNYLKAHKGWAWADVTPLDAKGKAVAEGGPSLLHYEQGAWKMMELPAMPEDPNDPMPAEDASPRFVKAVQKKYPGVPSDIFPKYQK